MLGMGRRKEGHYLAHLLRLLPCTSLSVQAAQEAAEKAAACLEEEKSKAAKAAAEELADVKAEHEATVARLGLEAEKAQVR